MRKRHLSQWWEKQKKRFPLVTRKWHISELNSQLKKQRESFDDSKSKAEQAAKELLERWSTFVPYRNDNKPPYDIRLEMTIDPSFLERVMFSADMTTGEQRIFARHLAMEFAYLVERELMTVNLATIGGYREMFERRYGKYLKYGR